MKFHKAANIFPLMEGEEYDALVEDIKANGLLESIITHQDKILDGRNRYRACKDAGRKPRYREYKGSDLLGYVLSKNVHRRHLSTGQRAFLGLEILPQLKKEAAERQKRRPKGEEVCPGNISGTTGEAKAIAAEMMGVSRKSLDQAEKLVAETPDLAKAVKSGEMTLGAANGERKHRLTQAAWEAEWEAELDPISKQKQPKYPPEVAHFFDFMKQLKKEIATAVEVVKYGKFSPEAKRFTVRRLKTIVEQMNEFVDRVSVEMEGNDDV